MEKEKTEKSGQTTTRSASAWGYVIDRAQLEISQYLAASTSPFDPNTPIARSMFTLLDHTCLKEIIVERNFNKMCGYFGCTREPLGIKCILDEGEADIHNWSDGEEEEKGDSDDGEVAEATKDKDEMVYEDDIYTEQSFRIAERQVKRLAQMTKRNEHIYEKEKDNPRATKYVPPGIPKEQRFCGVECLNLFEEDIQSAVQQYLEVNHPKLLSSVTHLFPNLNTAVLAKFAEAETSSTTAMVKTEVLERPTSEAAVAPVRTGVNHEVKPDEAGEDVDSKPKSSAKADDAEKDAVSLRSVLTSMEALKKVWSSETTRWLPAVAPSEGETRVEKPSPAPQTPPITEPSEDQEGTSSLCIATRPSLKGIYFAIDFLQRVMSTRSRNMLLLHYISNRERIRQGLASAPAASPLDFKNIINPAIASLEKKCERLQFAQGGSLTPSASWADTLLRLARQVDAPLRTAQREQRLQLFMSTVIGPQSTDYLSMLLMANPQSLSTLGWGEVWLELPAVLRLAAPEVRRAWGAEVPLSALLFNFTVTSSALQPASTSKESLLVSLLLLLASATVNGSRQLWAPLLSEALPELLDTLSLSADELSAGVRTILLDEEDP